MTDHTNPITRIEPFVHGLGKAILREIAEDMKASQAEIERFRLTVRDLNALQERQAGELEAAQAEIAKLTAVNHELGGLLHRSTHRADSLQVTIDALKQMKAAALARLAEIEPELLRVRAKWQEDYQLLDEVCRKAHEQEKRLAELAAQKPLAWCQLSIGGSSIAYFDGKPIVMVGPVGNNCHTTPLFAAAGASPVQPTKVPPYLQERLQDFTCEKVEDAGGTPGYTIYKTSLGRSGPYSLYDGEALALWINIGKALGPELTGAFPVQTNQAALSVDEILDIASKSIPADHPAEQVNLLEFAHALFAAINAKEQNET